MRRLLVFFRSGQGLPTYAALTLAWMILVVLEGAVVRATGSGAGCGDHWPLCNGQFLPHHPRLATIIEFTHRSMTGVCTALTAGLIAWTFLAHPRGARARKAVVWSGLLLVTEALLGAILVLGRFVEHNTSDLRVLVQGIHFTNTMVLLAALALAWWWQKPRPELRATNPLAPRLAPWALFCTILTGATGSVAALADTLFPAPTLHAAFLADVDPNSPLLIRMRWMHPAASLAAFILIAAIAFALQRGRLTLLLLLASQFLLGIADVFALAPLTLQVLHLLGADLLWCALVITSACLLKGARAPADLANTLIPKASPVSV